MELYALETGRFRLDGGAMFGVVPKEIWQRTNPADAQNRIDMAMRCLLVVEGDRRVLIDTGLGTKHQQDAKFQQHYAVDYSHTLEGSLRALGLVPEDITDVLLTHLHFDHGGGISHRSAEGRLEMSFPRAQVHVQAAHWHWAQTPNPRERASFFAENLQPLAKSGQLNLLSGETELFPGFRLLLTQGHTEAMQLPLLTIGGRQLLYAADFIPTAGHAPLPYVMAYDVRPLQSLEERTRLYDWLVDASVVLLLEHDPLQECIQLERTDRGGYRASAGQTLAATFGTMA